MPNDWSNAGLNGAVSELQEFEYRADFVEDQLQKQSLLSLTSYFYSELGFAQRSSYAVPNYNFSEHYEYNSRGNPLTVTISDEEQVEKSECKLRYDQNKRVVEEIWTNSANEFEAAYRNDYNDEGQLIQTKAYGLGDSLRIVRKFSYNAEGQLDTAFSYTPTGELQNFLVKAYEDDWLKRSSNFILRNAVPVLISQSDIRYPTVDEAGNWILKEKRVQNKLSNETHYTIVERKLKYFPNS